MAANPTKPASKRANSRKPKAKPGQPVDYEIAGARTSSTSKKAAPDWLAHWLRAERELKAA